MHPMAATGSSDAHEVDVVGCYFSELNADPLDCRFVAAHPRRHMRLAIEPRLGSPADRLTEGTETGTIDLTDQQIEVREKPVATQPTVVISGTNETEVLLQVGESLTASQSARNGMREYAQTWQPAS